MAPQQYKRPLHTLEQNKFETRFWHIIFGQGSVQRKCFDLEALANLRFSRGTGEPLDSEEIAISVHVVSELSPDGLGTTLVILRQ